MKVKSILFTALVATVTTLAVFFAANGIQSNQTKTEQTQAPFKLASMELPAQASLGQNYQNAGIDFRTAAAKVTPVVVHVKTTYKMVPVNQRGRDPFQEFFGDDFFRYFDNGRAQPQQAAGSGVIVSSDGYIITNNHVIDDADEIEVTLHNNKTYKAKLIGKDKDTDLALIKIEEANLPSIQFANSDSVEVGQWVLAVGNPFNLTSTVTAGIVSAKGRNINILASENEGSNTAIESFIQTDAAVNPGNSGGALVDLNGDLIGINTAIASNTGSFTGYSFAVPSNLVQKVYYDLKNYSVVQRGYLGVNIQSMSDELAKEIGTDITEGVYVQGVIDKSAADEAGLKKNDIVTQIDGINVKSASELQEQVGKHHPSDKITVTIVRDGKVQNVDVVLKNKYNNLSVVDDGKDLLNQLGIKVHDLDNQEAYKFKVRGGVMIDELKSGKIKDFTDVKEGFIITRIDDKPIANQQELVDELRAKKGNVTIEGVYPNKNFSYLYAFKM